ncbi:MAG: efflux RND transporter periplasmic adaptor subunit [Alphaproteobacteria bacterium]|nr:efflux RND transporter periplasmic adaptor subunit [Alphaproteobacteria bacterium]
MAPRMVLQALMAAGVAALIAFPVPAQEKGADAEKAARVGLDAVIKEQTRQTLPVLGRLAPDRAGVVSVQVSGVVESVPVRVGDRVTAGDALVMLAPDRLKWQRELRDAEVQSAKASLESARTQASLRRQEYDRLKGLKSSAAFSSARFDDAGMELAKAESDAARAEAEVARTAANLNLADIDLALSTVRAPYTGVVSDVHTEVGTYLSIGQSVVSLVGDTGMELEAEVPGNRTQGLVPGTEVSFTLRDGQTHTALVRAVVPSENPLTRTRKVRFRVADEAVLHGAAANQGVNLQIPAGPAQDVVTVHKDALVNKDGRRVVFVLADGKAEMRPVKLGDAVGTRFVVLSGVEPGEQVVVRGNERLRPGQDIEPMGKK